MTNNLLAKANVINILSDYLGVRDVTQLTPVTLIVLARLIRVFYMVAAF